MSRRLLIPWLLACGLGELLGLAVAALAMFLDLRAGEPRDLGARLLVLGGMLGAGALEGAITGTLQWLVLRRAFRGLDGRAWVGATALVAVLGWAAGRSVPLFVAGDGGAAATEPPAAAILAFAAALGAGAGALFGLAQGWVLRGHARRWPAWIAANAIGWALGLPLTYLAGSLETQSAVLVGLAGGAAGLAMGLLVALATGVALLRMTALDRPAPARGPRVLRLLAPLAAVLVVLGGAAFGWRQLGHSFVVRYAEDNYHPVALTQTPATPPDARVDSLVWNPVTTATCQPAALAILSSERLDAPVAWYDLLMTFSWGASEVPGQQGIFPATDPEPGFAQAAPYLALTHRYQTTDDAARFLAAIRAHLARGQAVRVPLDAAVLWRLPGTMAHNEVVVGYRGDTFELYEPVCAFGLPCQPGRRERGAAGLPVSGARLLEASRALTRSFGLPWAYALVVLEPARPSTQASDLRPLWQRAGTQLIGGAGYGPASGAEAWRRAAEAIARRSGAQSMVPWRTGLETLVTTRRQSAALLREYFPGDAELASVAQRLEASAALAEPLLAETAIPAARLAEALRSIGATEREAGATLLTRARRSEPDPMPPRLCLSRSSCL